MRQEAGSQVIFEIEVFQTIGNLTTTYGLPVGVDVSRMSGSELRERQAVNILGFALQKPIIGREIGLKEAKKPHISEDGTEKHMWFSLRDRAIRATKSFFGLDEAQQRKDFVATALAADQFIRW